MPSVLVIGEDVGQLGGRLPRDGRAAGALRRRSLRRHAARGGRHPRHRDRPLHGGLAARVRDAVRRVQLPVARPAHQPRRPLPLAHAREDVLPDRDPHAVRRRRARARAPRRLARDVLRAHARREGRHPVEPGRREGPPRRRDPRSRPGRDLRAEAPLPHAKGEVPDGEHVVPLGEARVAREGTDVTFVAYGAMVPLAESAADALAGEASVEVLDIRTLKPLDEDVAARLGGEDGQGRARPGGAAGRADTQPRSRRSSPRRRSTTSAARSCA